MRCGKVVCVRVLQVPSAYAFASEAGMLAIRAGACVCALVYMCVYFTREVGWGSMAGHARPCWYS